ncbi:MAG: diacylglycerol kinase family protein [Myxococcota bacterium]|nr:diacylglycerol kinase family protein [Myxococcota bacterium]
MTDTWVIANPRAGSADAGDELRAAAEGRGWRWLACEDAADGVRFAKEACARGAERVLAAGGDGTVHTVARGLLEAGGGPVLGVLPMGTGNDLARSLGLGVDPMAALEAIEGGRVRRIDVGRFTSESAARWMINVSAWGFAGEVDRVLEDEAKRTWGTLAYVGGALEVLSDLPLHDVQLFVAGSLVARSRCVGVTVANARTCGGGVVVAPTADLEDGLLDVTFVEEGSPVQLATTAARLRSGQTLSDPRVRHHLGSDLALRVDPPMLANVDGELLGRFAEARFEVRRAALPVFVGEGYRREPVPVFDGWTSQQ